MQFFKVSWFIFVQINFLLGRPLQSVLAKFYTFWIYYVEKTSTICTQVEQQDQVVIILELNDNNYIIVK